MNSVIEPTTSPEDEIDELAAAVDLIFAQAMNTGEMLVIGNNRVIAGHDTATGEVAILVETIEANGTIDHRFLLSREVTDSTGSHKQLVDIDLEGRHPADQLLPIQSNHVECRDGGDHRQITDSLLGTLSHFESDLDDMQLIIQEMESDAANTQVSQGLAANTQGPTTSRSEKTRIRYNDYVNDDPEATVLQKLIRDAILKDLESNTIGSGVDESLSWSDLIGASSNSPTLPTDSEPSWSEFIGAEEPAQYLPDQKIISSDAEIGSMPSSRKEN